MGSADRSPSARPCRPATAFDFPSRLARGRSSGQRSSLAVLAQLEAPSLWASSSRLVEELGPIGRDALLRFAQVHSALPHLHRQKILNRIFFLEEPLGKRDSGRSALRPYVVQSVGPTEARRGNPRHPDQLGELTPQG